MNNKYIFELLSKNKIEKKEYSTFFKELIENSKGRILNLKILLKNFHSTSIKINQRNKRKLNFISSFKDEKTAI